VLREEKPPSAIVFERTKRGCQRLADDLNRLGHRAKALHGDLTQSQRDSVMIAFRAGRIKLLVGTDVASRGLDVSGVTHIFNYELPDSPEVYVHRIGRTGRAGATGRAVSFVANRDGEKLAAIEKLIGKRIGAWGDEASSEDAEAAVVDATATGARETAVTTSAPEGDAPRRRRGRRGGRGRNGATAAARAVA
jgi:superfamily II DNA/RNA helicase